MLRKIIEEIEWQLGKLLSIKEHLLKAQAEADELEAYSAGKENPAPGSERLKGLKTEKEVMEEKDAAEKELFCKHIEEKIHENNKKNGKRVVRKTSKKRGPRVKLTDE